MTDSQETARIRRWNEWRRREAEKHRALGNDKLAKLFEESIEKEPEPESYEEFSVRGDW